MAKKNIGMDSNCFSYLIDILGSISRLSEIVSVQQLALIRLYFYQPINWWLTPAVELECKKITEFEYAEQHKSFMSTLFSVRNINDSELVKERTIELVKLTKHKEKDCRVLAEAEDSSFDILLTYDKKFFNSLSSYAKGVRIVKPATYWEELQIKNGAPFCNIPVHGNPLLEQNFWHW